MVLKFMFYSHWLQVYFTVDLNLGWKHCIFVSSSRISVIMPKRKNWFEESYLNLMCYVEVPMKLQAKEQALHSAMKKT